MNPESPTRIRRNDRAVADDAWIVRLLRETAVGTLATVRDGQPFLNTNLFVYDERAHAIYLHTAHLGRTRDNVAADPRACFSVFGMGRLLPAGVALEFSVEYAGVVAFGRVSLVADEDEALGALQRLMDKYAPHLRPERDYVPPLPQDLKRTSVIKLEIEDWSGKQKAAPPDFPGAYRFGEVAP